MRLRISSFYPTATCSYAFPSPWISSSSLSLPSPLSLFLALLFVQPPGCTTLSFSRALLRLSSITLVPSLHSCQLDFLHSSLSPSLPLCRSLAPLVRLNSSFRLFYTRIDVWIVFRRKTKRIQPPNELSSICIPLHPSPRVSHDVA